MYGWTGIVRSAALHPPREARTDPFEDWRTSTNEATLLVLKPASQGLLGHIITVLSSGQLFAKSMRKSSAG